MRRFQKIFDRVDRALGLISAGKRLLLHGSSAMRIAADASGRWCNLDSRDLFIEEICLHAVSAGEARRAVELDSGRFLPLEASEVSFDVVGPLVETALRPSRDQRFLIACVRLDRMIELRRSKQADGAVEAFSHRPAAAPEHVFVFSDARGKVRQRLRRGMTLLAVGAVCATMGCAIHSLDTALAAGLDQSQKIELQAKRRLDRLVLATQQRDAVIALTDARSAPIAQIPVNIQMIGAALPPDSELTSIDVDHDIWRANGLTADPIGLELSLRRALGERSLKFESSESQNPGSYEWRFEISSGGFAP